LQLLELAFTYSHEYLLKRSKMLLAVMPLNIIYVRLVLEMYIVNVVVDDEKKET
jgi:hypothetical protein